MMAMRSSKFKVQQLFFPTTKWKENYIGVPTAIHLVLDFCPLYVQPICFLLTFYIIYQEL
jgi:hypothetical protein